MQYAKIQKKLHPTLKKFQKPPLPTILSLCPLAEKLGMRPKTNEINLISQLINPY